MANDFMKTTSVGGDDLDTSLYKFMTIVYEQLEQHPGANITMINLQKIGITCGLKSIPTQNQLIDCYHWNCRPCIDDAANLHKLMNEAKHQRRTESNASADKKKIAELQQQVNILQGQLKAMENRVGKPVDVTQTDEFRLAVLRARIDIEKEVEAQYKEYFAEHEEYEHTLLCELNGYAQRVLDIKEKFENKHNVNNK